MLDLRAQKFLPFERHASEHPAAVPIQSNAIVQVLDPDEQEEVVDGASLVQEASKPFDVQSFLEGHMTPVFFGSALRHFGVSELLAGIGAYAPAPKPAPKRRKVQGNPVDDLLDRWDAQTVQKTNAFSFHFIGEAKPRIEAKDGAKLVS